MVYHEERIAKKCRHRLHPSAASDLLYCLDCLKSRAKSKYYEAVTEVHATGGTDVQNWNQRRNLAKLKLNITRKRLDELRKKDQVREEKEDAWDKAHQGLSFNANAASLCPVCTHIEDHQQSWAQPALDRNTTWWERLKEGAMEIDSAVETDTNIAETRTRPASSAIARRPVKATRLIKRGTVKVREEIKKAQKNFFDLEQFWDQWDRTYDVMRAFKDKVKPKTADFPIGFFDTPHPAAYMHWHHRKSLIAQRKKERRARQGKCASNPGRSPLINSQSTADISPQVTRMWQNKDLQDEAGKELQRQRNRDNEEIRKHIGFLYFVGFGSRIDECDEVFLKSNQRIVTRWQLEPYERRVFGDHSS